MKSKKTLSFVLSGLIAFGLSSRVYAEEGSVKGISSNAAITVNDASKVNDAINQNASKVSKDEAKIIAKKSLKDYFEMTIDETEYQMNVSFRPNYTQFANSKDYVWEISWNYNRQDKNVYINVSVDASTGKVIAISNRSYTNGKISGIATLTEDKAKSIGESFLNRIKPQEFSQCKLVNNEDANLINKGDATTYNFNYYRVVNGISFKSNNLAIGVDGITGKVISYSINWSDNELPTVLTDSISKEKANQIFNDNIKLKLKYIDARDPYGKTVVVPTLKLAYVLDIESANNINAKDGKMLQYDNIQIVDQKSKDLDITQKKAFLSSYKPLQKLDKELDSSAAEVIMKKLVNEIYGAGYDIKSTNYQDSNYGTGMNVNNWSGQFSKGDLNSKFQDQGSITIDALTGQLQSINKYNPYAGLSTGDVNAKPALTWEQSYDKAIEAVKKYSSDKVKDIFTEQEYNQLSYYNKSMEGSMVYNFNFNRLLNGIAYQNNSVNVTIDAKSGEIEQVYNSWAQDIKGILSEGTMNLEDAKSLFFKKYVPELSYTLVNTSKDSNKPVFEVKLVFSIQGVSRYINLII